MTSDKMFDATEEGVLFLSVNYCLEVPFFQRRYVWKEDNWKEFYDNFFKTSTPGFLGSIILKNIPVPAGKGKRVSVIDGQQRLTTLSIFVKALYDSLSSEDRRTWRNTLINALYRPVEKREINGEQYYVPRLEHSRLDRDDFVDVMACPVREDADGECAPARDREDQLHACYWYFAGRFRQMDYEERLRVLSSLLVGDIKIFVVITVYDGVDEQKVFDTLNTAGVKLTMGDTIKNYLFSRADKLLAADENTGHANHSNDVIELYNGTWQATFCKDDKTDKLWNQEVATGRIKRTHIDLFLSNFATIQRFYTPDETLSNLPDLFKRQIDRITTAEEMRQLLNELRAYGELYKEIFLTKDDDRYGYDNREVLPRLLLCENVLGGTAFNAYILYLYRNFGHDEAYVNERLHQLEKFILINFLTHNTSLTKNYNNLCVDFIKDGSNLDEKLADLLNLDLNVDAVQRPSHAQAKLLLFLVEIYRRRNLNYDLHKIEYSNRYQLEHILPQKWKAHWSEPGSLAEADDNGERFVTEEQQIQYRDLKLRALGNMTILTGKLNDTISNGDFATKIEGDNSNPEKPKAGIRQYSDFSITRDDVVAYYDAGNSWNEARINERSKALFEELKEGYLY